LNLYAPSVAEKKNEREYFFNTELTYILPTITTDMIIARDFNCFVERSESTGNTNYSRD
jgi:hypothetical protein